MELNFTTTKEKYYIQIITLFRSIPPFNTLRTQEILVLAWLMYYHNKIKTKRNLNELETNLILFDNEYKNKIIDKLLKDDEDGTAYEKALARFSNILTSLRKKKFILIIKNKNTLNTKFIFNHTKISNINFKFNIVNK